MNDPQISLACAAVCGRMGAADQSHHQAGGLMTSGANNQMRAIVRTTVTQMAVEVDRFVALNPLITNRYRYTAVLDSRTSARCRSLDGKTRVGQGSTASAALQLSITDAEHLAR